MKFGFTIFLSIYLSNVWSQTYIKSNEERIFSFETNKHKLVYLVKDKSNKYICYRYGSKQKIEFEFPQLNKESWKQFKYSFYLRGGGIVNEGLDLNSVYFKSQGFEYSIYNNYYSRGNEIRVGVEVINVKTNKKTDIKGRADTRKGTLSDFRDNNLLEIDQSSN